MYRVKIQKERLFLQAFSLHLVSLPLLHVHRSPPPASSHFGGGQLFLQPADTPSLPALQLTPFDSEKKGTTQPFAQGLPLAPLYQWLWIIYQSQWHFEHNRKIYVNEYAPLRKRQCKYMPPDMVMLPLNFPT
ncbi:hypothetical protein AAY473_034739 [Plecturocebus cupreus]